MRTDKCMVDLAKETSQKGKVIAAICHGPQLLTEAGVVKGKKATCCISVSTNLRNAGRIYLNESVVVDGILVTSRFPADLLNFRHKTLKLLESKKVEDMQGPKYRSRRRTA